MSRLLVILLCAALPILAACKAIAPEHSGPEEAIPDFPGIITGFVIETDSDGKTRLLTII